MPITVTCPNCHRAFRAGDHLAGRRVPCPDCEAVHTVPDDDLVQLDPFADEPDPYPGRDRPRRPSPRDHLPAWRRVATGFLVQQGAAVLLLVGLAALALSAAVLAEEPGNLQNEPTVGQAVASAVGGLALFAGFSLQAVGRMLAAGTPVRAPKGPAVVSAVGSVLAVIGVLLIGLFVLLTALDGGNGNQPDEALAMLAGLTLFGWMFVVAGSEAVHGFAVGSVGRVLRADGVRATGNLAGGYVILAGVLAIFAFCGLCAWMGAQNGQNPNAEPTEEQAEAMLVWMAAVGVAAGLYLVLDLVLLYQARAAIARLGADGEPAPAPEDLWD